MSAERTARAAIASVGVAVASGAVPVLVGYVRALFVTTEGEGFAIAFMVAIAAPASALAGLVAAILVYRLSARAARAISAWRVWLLTTAGALAGVVVGLVMLAHDLGAPFEPSASGLAPLLAVAAVGALPPAFLALRLRNGKPSGGDPAWRA